MEFEFNWVSVAGFNLISLKSRKSAKGRGSCGLSAAKKKAEEGGGERGRVEAMDGMQSEQSQSNPRVKGSPKVSVHIIQSD